MIRSIAPALLLAAAAAPLGAQARSGTAATASSPGTVLRQTWSEVSAYLTRSAAAVPDSSYAYKPTPAVRSFGQLVAHVAGAQQMYCAAALGERAPAEGDAEAAGGSKADLAKALDASNAVCARAYALPASRLTETVQLFGGPKTRSTVLLMNVTHDYEHYGNVVTYLRLLGLVPPSSQPAPERTRGGTR